MNYTGVRLESFYCNVHTKNSEAQQLLGETKHKIIYFKSTN